MTEWTRYRIDAVGLELDVVDGVPVDAELGRDAGTVLQFAGDLEIAVWYGADAEIDRWAGGIAASWPRAVLGPEETVTLGDELTVRQRVALLPPEHVEGGFEREDGGLELRVDERPAREATAVALRCGGIAMLASVTAPAGRRADVAHVLTSLRVSSG
ncbi:MAG TPA: hypothetical protein VFX51_30050 [Solirubrobacteraceae bacterium]|nr:hypothetical protein [Solirubrobacteraceae bacterium]